MCIAVHAWLSALGVFLYMGLARAEITLDGSLGPGGALSGPDYAVTADLGRQIGSNLFHSFGRFNIDTGESATFSGPSSIDNILGRVTGGSASTIDGLLRSTIPEANLFLMNPAGVVFGPNASLDVQGAFHATTADFIRLADGTRFEAIPSSADAVLSTAPPQAFGFLDDTPAPITVDHSRLVGAEGEALSLVGGDIRMRGGTLSAPSGRINLASVGSAGLAVPANDDLQMRSLHGSKEIEQGKIRISQGSRVEVSGSGKGVFIRGGRFTLEGGSEIETLTTSADEGGDISVKASDAISVADSRIGANTFGDGKAGNITLEARTIKLDESAVDNRNARFDNQGNVVASGQGDTGTINISAAEWVSMSESSIVNRTFSSGDAGDICLETGSLLMGGSSISSDTFGHGHAGTLTIKARDTIKMSFKMSAFSFIDASTGGPGDAGNISIEARDLIMDKGLVVSNQGNFGTTGNEGNAGNIDIKARDTIKMSSFCLIDTSTEGAGDAGNISIEAGDLIMLDIAGIGSRSHSSIIGAGNAGNIDIKARDTIKMSGSSINTVTLGDGDAGTISIEADSLELRRGHTSLLVLIADVPELIVASSSINSASVSTRSDAGESGRIFVRARDSLRLFDGSRVSVETTRADAGDITLEVGDLLELRNGSSITTSVAGGQGDGGDIRIDPVFTVLDGGSRIVANARDGRGGNIFIRIVGGGALFRSPDSIIEASSALGIDGSVVIDSPDTDLTGGLVALPANFLDAAAILPQACAERLGGEVSRLVVRPYEVLPDSPYALRVGLPKAVPGAPGRASGERDSPRATQIHPPLALGCLDDG
jgi:filamentous hemagglutinin family protein